MQVRLGEAQIRQVWTKTANHEGPAEDNCAPFCILFSTLLLAIYKVYTWIDFVFREHIVKQCELF